MYLEKGHTSQKRRKEKKESEISKGKREKFRGGDRDGGVEGLLVPSKEKRKQKMRLGGGG